jgi:hypothetical protein
MESEAETSSLSGGPSILRYVSDFPVLEVRFGSRYEPMPIWTYLPIRFEMTLFDLVEINLLTVPALGAKVLRSFWDSMKEAKTLWLNTPSWVLLAPRNPQIPGTLKARP